MSAACALHVMWKLFERQLQFGLKVAKNQRLLKARRGKISYLFKIRGIFVRVIVVWKI